MPILTISHLTSYAYRQPVSFGEHRLLIRPHESYDQRVSDFQLDIDPGPAELRWHHDVFGNSVAIARFGKRATSLRFESRLRMEHDPLARDALEVEDYARLYPFSYAAEDISDLLRSIERQHVDPERVVDRWARQFVGGGQAETVTMLAEMNAAIRRDFTYVARHEAGTQSPVETLHKRQGTCRDYAVLMIEAARALGFAARFASGYLYNPAGGEGRVGGGNTHAWVRIFLPGSGWVDFDPTNGIVGSAGLVRVAVTRDPSRAAPLTGSWSGFPNSALGMTVHIEVRLDEPEPTEQRAVAAGKAR
jgi:transglutaminase-like putative cysteine protease